MHRTVVLAIAASWALATAAGAQRPTRPPAAGRPVRDTVTRRLPGDTIRGRADTLRTQRDTVTVADTAGKANLVEPDSTMRRLLSLPGYDARQVQGETITFDAATRGICVARRGTVASGDSVLVKSDSICTVGGGDTLRVGSTTSKGRNVITLPGNKPIYSTGVAVYDVRGRRALVTEVSTSLEQSGETLAIRGDRIVLVLPQDSSATRENSTVYLRDGTITACTDSIPDYFFKAGEIKRTGSFVVARPAVLYIGDVPVMWLPFLFQDVRGGRHSGILAPTVGVSDIVRNSPSYRRSVEGLGYYFALSDYFDAQVSLDWRSSAGRSDDGDQGQVRYTGEVRYNWLERYVNGRLALARTNRGPQQSTSISLNHSQEFTRNSSLNASYNYTTDAFLHRETSLNPVTVASTIGSSASYAHRIGPFSLGLGGQQTQYPGRAQLDRSFPSVNLSTSPLELASWLVWTPSLTYGATQRLHIDQPTDLGLFLRSTRTAAGLDSIAADLVERNAYTSSLSFGTPLTIFGFQLGNQFQVNSSLNDFPQREDVRDVLSGVETTRIYGATYQTTIDWSPSFTLPAVGRNNFNLTPSLSFENVASGSYAIRNHRTNGQWVTQKKRPTFGLSASPTFFGLFGGFGPWSRLRHSISPTFGYQYAPKSDVPNDFLAAIGETRYSPVTQDTTGYLGGLARNALSFRLSTNIEGKRRAVNDTNPEAGEKVKLLSVDFTSLSYNFERARVTGKAIRGLENDAFGYTVRSDLLPGFDVGVDYSLFEGASTSDSAKFKPFLTRVAANFSIGHAANPFAILTRLFGRPVPVTQPNPDTSNPTPDSRYERQLASQPVAGRSGASGSFLPTRTKGWQASFQFSASRQRPLTGDNVVANSSELRCAQFNTVAFRQVYADCLARERLNPTPETPIGSGLPGATRYSSPASAGLNTRLDFNLTDRWAASYNTQYDFENVGFASQDVSLVRDLHDWRAIFAFRQASNGAFSFVFNIALKAEPALKFDYHKSSYPGSNF